jgi:hypothetical protein
MSDTTWMDMIDLYTGSGILECSADMDEEDDWDDLDDGLQDDDVEAPRSTERRLLGSRVAPNRRDTCRR